MIIELILLIILIFSFLALIVMVLVKIPTLVSLPPEILPSRSRFFSRLKEKAKNHSFLKNFSFEVFLQKTLGKTRIIIMRLENKIFRYLQDLKEKTQRKKDLKNDNYWQDLKKPTDENKNLPE